MLKHLNVLKCIAKVKKDYNVGSWREFVSDQCKVPIKNREFDQYIEPRRCKVCPKTNCLITCEGHFSGSRKC